MREDRQGNLELLDIFAVRVLAKSILLQKQVVFQENYSNDTPAKPLGTKEPLILYIINHGSTPGTSPDHGSPVKCVKLCKRILEDSPQNTILCTQKSKVTIKFQLVLIVEFEDNTSVDALILPRNLSAQGKYYANITKAFVDNTVIGSDELPIIQNQNTVKPYETFVIKYAANETAPPPYNYTAFEYGISIPISSFDGTLKKCELDDPSLKSHILLRNLKSEVDILEQVQIYTDTGSQPPSVWTTKVQFSLFEDIIDKLGIDQDISIEGTPEFVCDDLKCT